MSEIKWQLAEAKDRAWSYKERYEDLLEAARKALNGDDSKLKELVENA